MKVSAYRTVFHDQGKTICFRKWLQGYGPYNQTVKELRREKRSDLRKKIKLTLPCCIPSGIFSAPNDQSLVEFSGLMSFDFDQVEEINAAKEEIMMSNPHVWYVGVSAGGFGLFALVAVAPDAIGRWKEYYATLTGMFGEASRYVDGMCSNISRKRFYSFDPEARYNEAALRNPHKLPLQQIKRPPLNPHPKCEKPSEQGKIEMLVKRIEENQEDITANYADWISIGGALANIFGEAGRWYFHRISQFYPVYRPEEVDKQFDRSLKRPPAFGIGIIFSIAKKHGLMIKQPV